MSWRMYILGVSVMQVHHDHWIGTSFLFIGGITSAYVSFLLDSTKEGSFMSWRNSSLHWICVHW